MKNRDFIVGVVIIVQRNEIGLSRDLTYVWLSTEVLMTFDGDPKDQQRDKIKNHRLEG